MLWSHDGKKWAAHPLHRSARGQLAVLCCPGPSFAPVDVARLRGPGRVVIGINSTYPRLRPDYWLGMDEPDNYEQSLFSESFPKILRGNYGDLPCQGRQLKELTHTLFADVSEQADLYDWTRDATFLWSRNTFFVALQFALWLGCRDLYLLGVDLDNTAADYADGTYLTPAQRAYNARLYAQTFQTLGKLVAKSAEFGVTWISGSSGSMINQLMPCVPLAAVLATVEKNVPTGRPKQHVLAAATAPAA